MNRFGVAILLLAGTFGGYRVYQHFTSSALSPQAVANEVGGAYGDPHPHLIRVISSDTDNPPHDPMYLITMSGHFHNGVRTARYLEFSALADRQYAWALWAGDTFPGHGAHRSWAAEVVPPPAGQL